MTEVQNSAPDTGSFHEADVVDLGRLCTAEPGALADTPPDGAAEKPGILEPNLQLMLRLSFTLLGILYFLLNPKTPLLINKTAILWLSGALAISFLVFHIRTAKRQSSAEGIQASSMLDITASHMAWLCDPWQPAPMMLIILIAAVGNGAHHGFSIFKAMLKIFLVTAPLVYMLRLAMLGFHSTSLLFMTLVGFILIYIYVLIHHIDALQRQSENKAQDLVYANERLQQTGRALQESEARYRSMFEHSGTATVLIEENMRISIVNSKFEELTGFTKTELCNKKKLTDFIFKKDLERIQRFHARRRAMGGIAPTEYECQLVDKHQNTRHVIIRFSITPWHERIIATLVDITSRKQAKAALQNYNRRLQKVAKKLQESQLRYRNLFENTGTATILVGNNMRISMANTKFAELTGFSKEELVGHRRLSEFIERKSLYRIRRYHARQKRLGLPPPTEYECLMVDRQRGMKHVVMKVYTPPGQNSSIVSFFDITTRKKAEAALQAAHEKLRAMAVSDELTQVANRRRFNEYLIREWNRLKRESLPLSLIMCDVDCFKRYNDHYGHQAGDNCLQVIANTIRRNLKRSVDLVARYGGEEFAVVLPNTHNAGALKIAESIRLSVEELKIPHDTSYIAPHITISLGVATMIPQRDLPPDRIIKEADQALYEAKNHGRNRTMVGTGGEKFMQQTIWEDNVIRLTAETPTGKRPIRLTRKRTPPEKNDANTE